MKKTEISAQVVAHSVSPQGDELVSVLCTFPRMILAEVNTHRMLSKNTSSSRAIPFLKMVKTVENDPFIPIAWQKEHSGMQGTEYFMDEDDLQNIVGEYMQSVIYAVERAKVLAGCGVTKQLANRQLEPFMWTTMLITGPRNHGGWDNFFNLRCPSYQFSDVDPLFKSKKEYCRYHKVEDKGTYLTWAKFNKGMAEIHMMDLAEKVYDAINESVPNKLEPGEWHIPFEKEILDNSGIVNDIEIVKISVAMAARTSYTVVGEEKEVDYEALTGLHDRLLAQTPPHSSPLEHCAIAMYNEEYKDFIKGKFEVNHSEPEYEDLGEFPDSAKGWCNNFKGFIPYRYLVDNNILDE